MGLSKIETMAIPNYDNIDINDAIEFYQIKRYFDDDIKPIDGPENWKEQFSEKSLELYKLTLRFFNSISNENIVSQYSIVDTNYTTAFWELFNNCKLYGKISEIEFEKIIRLKNINLYDILVHKNTVQKYGEIIKNVITDELEYVRILIDFYEQNYSQRKKIYLPDELTDNDIVKMLSDYLDSETAFFSLFLRSIQNFKILCFATKNDNKFCKAVFSNAPDSLKSGATVNKCKKLSNPPIHYIVTILISKYNEMHVQLHLISY